MSRSAGAGQPLYLKCSACKKLRDIKTNNALSGNLRRTGRERPYKPRGATGRMLKTAFECACLDCGHIGWYAHKGVLRLPSS